jgi:hypothetical protein
MEVYIIVGKASNSSGEYDEAADVEYTQMGNSVFLLANQKDHNVVEEQTEDNRHDADD